MIKHKPEGLAENAKYPTSWQNPGCHPSLQEPETFLLGMLMSVQIKK